MNSGYILKADSILTENGFESNKSIKVINGQINAINKKHPSDPDIAILDYTGYTISPCFIDYHLHLFKRSPTEEQNTITALNAYGITKIYEGGTSDLHAIKIKETLINGIRIKTAGCALFRKGTYGNYIGREVSNIFDAEELIDYLFREGVDFIKIINSGVYIPETGYISEGGFSFQDLSRIVGYAKSKGLDVACHVNGEQKIREAVEAGVSSIIHGLGVSDDTLSHMAEKKIAFIPTVTAFESLKKISKQADAVRNIEEAVAHHLKSVKSASDRGVSLFPGSDAGASFIPYGSSYLEELSLFYKAGIRIEKVISSAIEGHFKISLKADFLVLDGLRVVKVYKNGSVIKTI